MNAEVGRDSARAGNYRTVLLGRAVREVDAQHVGTADEERAEHCGFSRGGTDRCDDLRAFLKYGFHCERWLCA